jgi:glycosyltransferase involved in cell wall biosynthesis
MKVIHLSHSNYLGGAAMAGYRLHKGLRRLGVDSTMLVAESHSAVDDPTVVLFQPPMDLPSRLRRRLRRERIARSWARYRSSRPAGYAPLRDDRTPHGAHLLAQLPPADIVNIHDMTYFIDYRAFFAAVPQHTPVVPTLHDMTFFTGGCHYAWRCDKYTERCGACPHLGSHKEADLSRHIWQRKHAALQSVEPGRLHLVTPSRWLANEAKRSGLVRNFPITVIPYGLDMEVFCPRDRAMARELLGIPHEARAVLFVANGTARPEKGFSLLVRALEGLGHLSNLLLVSVGGGKLPVEVQIPYLHLGHIGHDRLLSFAYSAADIFVIPSLQDNLPQTVLEAMACGTPVVGFAVGGIPDMVRPGATGLLVPPQDVAALRSAIAELLHAPARRAEMAATCRRVALEDYALELQAQRYLELYQTLLASHGTGNSSARSGLRAVESGELLSCSKNADFSGDFNAF